MSKNKKPKREPQFAYKCIFCDNIGATFEHVISKWISRRFPSDIKTSSQTQFKFDYIQKTDQVFITPSYKSHNRPLGSKQAKIVCKNCNGTWMSVIVNASRPTIIDLIEKQSFQFTTETAMNLAAWVMLTNIIFEYDQPQTKTIRKTDRTFLKDQGFPPENYEIWIAATDSEEYIRRLRHIPFSLSPHLNISDIQVVNPIIQHSLIGIEKSIFLSRSIYRDNIIFKDIPILDEKFIKIWPFNGIIRTFSKNTYVTNQEIEEILYDMSDPKYLLKND